VVHNPNAHFSLPRLEISNSYAARSLIPLRDALRALGRTSDRRRLRAGFPINTLSQRHIHPPSQTAQCRTRIKADLRQIHRQLLSRRAATSASAHGFARPCRGTTCCHAGSHGSARGLPVKGELINERLQSTDSIVWGAASRARKSATMPRFASTLMSPMAKLAEQLSPQRSDWLRPKVAA